MRSPSPLYFPPKVALIVGLLVGLPLIYIAIQWLAQGHTTVTSSAPKAYIIDESTQEELLLPVNLTRSAGRHRFTVASPGYVNLPVTVAFWPFRITRQVSYDLDKKLYNEEDPTLPKSIPLYSVLPFADAHFSIELPDENGDYTVTLYAILNRPDQLASYNEQLTAYGQEALAWIKSKGVDPTQLKLKWLPIRPDGITLGTSVR